MPLKSTNLGQIVLKGVIAYLWTSTVKNHQGGLGKNLCEGKISKSNLTFGGKLVRREVECLPVPEDFRLEERR